MTSIGDLQLVRDALDARSLLTAPASFGPDAFVELEGGPVDIVDTLASLDPPIVLVYEVLGTPSPLLDDTDALHAALLDEYRSEFASDSVAVAIAAPVAGVLLGATFWDERWVEFEERVEAAFTPEPVSDQQLQDWATLCAHDPGFRSAGAQKRPGVARDIIGSRPNHDVVTLVEQAALEMMAETLGPEARRLHAAKVSKDTIRAQLRVPKSLIDIWLADQG